MGKCNFSRKITTSLCSYMHALVLMTSSIKQDYLDDSPFSPFVVSSSFQFSIGSGLAVVELQKESVVCGVEWGLVRALIQTDKSYCAVSDWLHALATGGVEQGKVAVREPTE